MLLPGARSRFLAHVTDYGALTASIKEVVESGRLVPCVNGGLNPDLWYSEDRRGEEEAKRHCNGCPVVEECLGYALAAQEWGIWGATTMAERYALHRVLAGRLQ